jgi:5-formyltetrahydrofolate cyclo-ligase
MDETKQAKRRLRDKVLAAADMMNEDQKDAENRIITRKIIEYIGLSGITNLMSFISMTGEFDTGAVMRWAGDHGLFVSIPRIAPRSSLMSFHRYDPDSLELHPFGFRQPSAQAEIFDPHTTEKNRTLMLVPGAAFTDEGMRLGRGGGFYDRYLEVYGDSITTAGICFSAQMCTQVPVQPHDIRLDMVITVTADDH